MIRTPELGATGSTELTRQAKFDACASCRGSVTLDEWERLVLSPPDSVRRPQAGRFLTEEEFAALPRPYAEGE